MRRSSISTFSMPALALALVVISGMSASGKARLHQIFTDGAVLQRETIVPVWGTADDGEKVTVSFNGQTVPTKAVGGKWLVRLSPMKAGGPFRLRVSGEHIIELTNVMVGDVWVCGGQSNMWWPLVKSENGSEAAAGSADTGLRLLTIPQAESATALTGLPENVHWAECDPQTSASFSAVAYFFGRELRRKLKVPIGLIHASVIGSPAQLWMDPKYMQGITPNYESSLLGKHYFGMITPLQPYAIKGVIWYQGEGNAWKPEVYQYQKVFTALIDCWRTDWHQGQFPFLFVQLAPFAGFRTDPAVSHWAELREAQLMTSLSVANTAMVVTTDVGEPDNIHPPKKQPVGLRLANCAMKIAYRAKGTRTASCMSPVFRSVEISGNRAVVAFDNAGDGLIAGNGPLTGFTVCGPDGIFRDARAEIRGKVVVVSSPLVDRPVAVRYGWDDSPDVNLFNSSGLPASPFRTDRPSGCD